MGNLQKLTAEDGQTAIKPYKHEIFDAWLTWKACGGLMVDEEDNRAYRMTLTDFCQTFGVTRPTVGEWRKNTPNLAELIEQRRNEIAPLAKVTNVFNQMYLTAMQTKDKRAAVEAQKAYLGHFGKLQLPVQRQDVKLQVNNWSQLLQKKREVIEAEIVDEPENHNG